MEKFHFQFYNVFNKAAALLRISGGPVRRKKSRAVQMVLIHYRCRELFTSSSLETKVGILSRVEKGGSGDNSAEIVWPKCDFSRGLCCRRRGNYRPAGAGASPELLWRMFEDYQSRELW
jgi:hypothetical protein